MGREERPIEQVLTPLAAKSIMGTAESDPLSIMCYQIPGEITKNGKAIPGGVDINANDFAFAAKVYPKTGTPPKPPRTPAHVEKAKPDEKASPMEEEAVKPEEGTSSSQWKSVKPRDTDTLQIVIMDEFIPESKAAPRTVDHTEARSDTPPAVKQPKGPKYARVFASYGSARGHVRDASACRRGRGEHGLRQNHRHARAHQELHQSRKRLATLGRADGEVRERPLRDAVSGRCAAAL